MSATHEETSHVRADGAAMSFASGHAAFREVTFSVPPGQFLALLGPSGCGKSTLLRLIAGLITPTAGRVTVGNSDAREARHACRIGFVFQDPRLLPWRTAAQNVRLPLELEHVPPSERQTAGADALRLVGLAESDGSKTPSMLSGGMRMRVSLARALVTRPQLLLLDEPFAALDDVLRQQLNDELLRIWSERPVTTIFVTHNVAEAVYLSQRVFVLTRSPGRIAANMEIAFPYPRRAALRATAEFARRCGDVSTRLEEGAR